jgi:hypothetical protein
MSPEALLSAVQAHHGIFLCERIDEPRITKEAPFRHLVTAPQPDVEVPALGRLDDVYKAFGSITFYHHEASGDAARYLAAPAEWPALADALADWLEMLDEDELEAILPHGLEGCVVIGETPASGNYILVPKSGPNTGKVIEFDHDGCEFTVVAGRLRHGYADPGQSSANRLRFAHAFHRRGARRAVVDPGMPG